MFSALHSNLEFWCRLRDALGRLGTPERMSSFQGFSLTPALTFHPGSVSQTEKARSVTDPLDSSDKDEDDI